MMKVLHFIISQLIECRVWIHRVDRFLFAAMAIKFLITWNFCHFNRKMSSWHFDVDEKNVKIFHAPLTDFSSTIKPQSLSIEPSRYRSNLPSISTLFLRSSLLIVIFDNPQKRMKRITTSTDSAEQTQLQLSHLILHQVNCFLKFLGNFLKLFSTLSWLISLFPCYFFLPLQSAKNFCIAGNVRRDIAIVCWRQREGKQKLCNLP